MPGEGRIHPRLTTLLRQEGWTALTAAQEAVLEPLASGHHVLLVAPTGHGKTEAAMLPILGRLLTEREQRQKKGKPWPPGFKVLYITPLRALNRDLLGRLQGWGESLGLQVGVRHGDTPPAERSRQSRNPPDVLITTPETVQLLLYGDTLRRHLRTVRFVVVDEVHELVASERGAQLAVALERIEEVVAQPEALAWLKAGQRPCPPQPHTPAGTHWGFQRIGLSATVEDADAVAHALAGPNRHVDVVRVSVDKELDLHIVHPEVSSADEKASSQLAVSPATAAQIRVVRDVVAHHQRAIVFCNTRDGAEVLASRSAMLDNAPLMELHHGSLAAEYRADVEARFKRGDLHAVVATSSLELGIDVGTIDHVVQVQSPRSVARLVQRLGRAGHRVGEISRGTLVASGTEDVLECMAVARQAIAGELEPLRIRESPLVVLANQIVALSNEYADLNQEWVWEVIRRTGPFANLDRGLYEAVWEALLDAKTVFQAEGKTAGHLGRSGRGRRHFLDHVGLIPDEKTYRVIDEAGKRTVGIVDDAFVAASLHPGASFIMAGRPWQVLEIEAEAQRVRVTQVQDLGAVPQWSGSQLPVSAQVAREVAALRGAITAGQEDVLASYPVDPAALAFAAEPIIRHQDSGLQVPTDRIVTIESSRRALTINVALGTRGNETLGRITQALLHQRLGQPVGMESDAYRIHLELPGTLPATDVETIWHTLEPETLDLVLMRILRDTPAVRHHLVHVAKHFGALPKDLDPNRFSQTKLEALLQDLALHEESLSRLIWDRMDIETVQDFLIQLEQGAVTVVCQALGTLSTLGREEARRATALPRDDTALLDAVRNRILGSDILLACCHCSRTWESVIVELPRRIICLRCRSNQIACLRPWDESRARLIRRDVTGLDADQRRDRERILRNGALVASFGPTACHALVGRGVGPDVAARILQKIPDSTDPRFWREVLLAELTFARTHAFWDR